jgi:hypothetical protein
MQHRRHRRNIKLSLKQARRILGVLDVASTANVWSEEHIKDFTATASKCYARLRSKVKKVENI